jgi:two-component system, chemotaxis family, chemotaxis protein CheY
MAVRVLIADSSGMTRDIIRNHLECGGCQVIAETETVAQTIDLFRTTRPDVVTLDVWLRGGEGNDALSLFRTIRQESPQTSIVVISASQSPDDSQVYLREGALECLVEPFDSVGLGRMWRHLAELYPELKRRDETYLGAVSPAYRQSDFSSSPSGVQLKRVARARN